MTHWGDRTAGRGWWIQMRSEVSHAALACNGRLITDCQITRQALSYIERHLGETISLNDLCTHCCASRSTIERAFRRELGLTPTKFLRKRRLFAVRRHLTDGNTGERTITAVAMNNGFMHLGRFARDYRELFGERPSDTLRASVAAAR